MAGSHLIRRRGPGTPTADAAGLEARRLPAWKLALQQHTRSSSRGSSRVSSPAGTHRSGASERSLDIDMQDSQYAARMASRSSRTCDSAADNDLLLIRELAVDLLDSVSKEQQRPAKMHGEGLDEAGRHDAAAARQASKRRHDDVNVSEAMLSEAPTTNQSASVSPERATSPVLAWDVDLSASPTNLPIRCFPTQEGMMPQSPSRPTSATSASLSERKRRTRRSSASSASGQDELVTVDLRGLDEIAREQPIYFRFQQLRPESAHGRVDPGRRAQMDWLLSPKHDRVRASTAMGHRKQESLKPRRDYGARSEPASPTVHFPGIGDGIQRDSLHGPSRPGSPSRPKSAASRRPAYLQPSQSYLRSLAEPKPSTPGM
jgi:hypothetical protein